MKRVLVKFGGCAVDFGGVDGRSKFCVRTFVRTNVRMYECTNVRIAQRNRNFPAADPESIPEAGIWGIWGERA